MNIIHVTCSNTQKYYICFSVAVIACFLICWTPYHVLRMMTVILTLTDGWSSNLRTIRETLYIVSGITNFENVFDKLEKYLMT